MENAYLKNMKIVELSSYGNAKKGTFGKPTGLTSSKARGVLFVQNMAQNILSSLIFKVILYIVRFI